MSEAFDYITITNTETGRSFTAVEGSARGYVVTTSPPMTVELVRKRSIGKRIREFMKEKI